MADSPLSTLLPMVLGAVAGFLVGVLVNLIADYLPARRLHLLASASPFVSPTAIPPLPSFIPHLPDGQRAPFYTWSGITARLTGIDGFREKRWRRRVLVEIGLTLLYAWIVATYGGLPDLPFLLVYAPALVIYVVVDIEYRWILNSTIWPIGVLAVIDSLVTHRVSINALLRGGAITLGIMLLLYVLGIGFGQGLGAVSKRRVGRTVFGFGDVRLAVIGGLLVGWPHIGLALLIMVFTGALGALLFITNKLLRTRRYRAFSAIPYGPYIVVGIAIMLYVPTWIGDLIGACVSR